MAKLTKDEQQRNRRRRSRQMLGLGVIVLMMIGVLSIVRSGAGLVEKLFDDTDQKHAFEANLQGLVMFDPLPFDGVANIQDTTLREAAVWGTVYQILATEDGLTNYERDDVTDQVMLPMVEVDAYLAKIFGPDFKMTHKTFESQGMTMRFDEALQCYYIPITSFLDTYTPLVTDLVKKSGRLYATVGYVPTFDSNALFNTGALSEPTKYMDYVFERKDGEWYLVALQESEKVAPPASSETVLTEALPPLEDFEATVLEDLNKGQEEAQSEADASLESTDTDADVDVDAESDAQSDAA